jgi:hypothetical protein
MLPSLGFNEIIILGILAIVVVRGVACYAQCPRNCETV